MLVNSLVYAIPVTSERLSQVTYFCAGATVVSLGNNYRSPLGWFGACATFALSLVHSVKARQEEQRRQQAKADKFCSDMLDWVTECVRYDRNPYSRETRGQMLEVINSIRQDRACIQQGNEENRAKFVGMQNAMEHVLTAQKILKKIHIIVAAIHTPLPPTPLCTPIDGSLVTNLTAPSLQHNPDILCTVADRAVSIRRMLAQDRTVLFAIFPRSGLEKRKQAELDVFGQEVERYRDRLIAHQLDREIEPARVGAIYLLSDADGNEIAFSIKAHQANDPQANAQWGIWFGVLTHPVVNNRVQDTTQYLSSLGAPNLLQRFAQACAARVLH